MTKHTSARMPQHTKRGQHGEGAEPIDELCAQYDVVGQTCPRSRSSGNHAERSCRSPGSSRSISISSSSSSSNSNRCNIRICCAGASARRDPLSCPTATAMQPQRLLSPSHKRRLHNQQQRQHQQMPTKKRGVQTTRAQTLLHLFVTTLRWDASMCQSICSQTALITPMSMYQSVRKPL